MSVAGILASSLFSNAISQIAQKSPTATNKPGLPSDFATIQQEFAEQPAQASGSALSPSPITLLGQGLASGNLPISLAGAGNISTSSPITGSSSNSASKSGQNTDFSTDPLSAAWQAYSSLQGNPLNSALSKSLLASGNSLSINV
jgi:hypothetical protein